MRIELWIVRNKRQKNTVLINEVQYNIGSVRRGLCSALGHLLRLLESFG